jgi:hypothetical protein
MANEGTIASTRNNILITQNPWLHDNSTLSTCNSKIYCMTKPGNEAMITKVTLTIISHEILPAHLYNEHILKMEEFFQ